MSNRLDQFELKRKNISENVNPFTFELIDCLYSLNLTSWCDRVIKYECNNIQIFKKGKPFHSFHSFRLFHCILKVFLNRSILFSCEIVEKYQKMMNYRIFLQSNDLHWTDFKKTLRNKWTIWNQNHDFPLTVSSRGPISHLELLSYTIAYTLSLVANSDIVTQIYSPLGVPGLVILISDQNHKILLWTANLFPKAFC
jgi:hypothetical protein